MLDEFNNKLLELKFQQTKREYNMISSMSQPGTFTLNEKDIKRINKEVLKENYANNYKSEKRKILKIYKYQQQLKIILLFR